MGNFPFIRTPRQKRAIEFFLQVESITPKELGCCIGALNPAQIISELRNQGFRELILTEHFHVRDRDGNLCLPGRYRILPGSRPILEGALNRYQISKGDVYGRE